jgi:pimeloyl-ACP methyl ester carboxylesterase
MWDDQFDFFAQKYKVVRYDMRGFGQSPPVADDYQRHEDIRALLDYLDIDHAYLMGCSMGGGACMNFVLDYPDRANALMMVGSAPVGFSYDEWSPSPLDEEMEAAYHKGDMERVNELEMQMFVDGKGRTPDQVNPALRKKVYDMNMIVLRNCETKSCWAKMSLRPLPPPNASANFTCPPSSLSAIWMKNISPGLPILWRPASLGRVKSSCPARRIYRTWNSRKNSTFMCRRFSTACPPTAAKQYP